MSEVKSGSTCARDMSAAGFLKRKLIWLEGDLPVSMVNLLVYRPYNIYNLYNHFERNS